MTLREWLKLTRTRQIALAQKLGISVASVSRIAAGEQFPSRTILERLYVVTGGAVTPNDVIGMRIDADFAPDETKGQTGV